MWLKNPLPYFDRYPEADILATTDLRAPSVEDDGLELPAAIGWADLNIGMK